MICPACGHIWICGDVHSFTSDKGSLLECGRCGLLFWEIELAPDLFKKVPA